MFGGFSTAEEFKEAWAGTKKLQFPLNWTTVNLLLVGRGISCANRQDFIMPLLWNDVLSIDTLKRAFLLNKNCCLSEFYVGATVNSTFLNKERRVRDANYVNWFIIVLLADYFDVAPEILVDDDAYYATDVRVRSSGGFRFYMIPFTCWKQGLPPDVLCSDDAPENRRRYKEDRRAAGLDYVTNHIYKIGSSRRFIQTSSVMDFTLMFVCKTLGLQPRDMFMILDKGCSGTLSLMNDVLPKVTQQDALLIYGLMVLLTAPAVRGNKQAIMRGVEALLDKQAKWEEQIDG